MSASKWSKRFLSHEELEKINQKIKQLESSTSAEIVTVIANRSSTVSHVRVTLFLLLNFLSLIVYFGLHAYELHLPFEPYLFCLIPIIHLEVSLLLSRFDFVLRLFVPKKDRFFQVQSRSELEFYIQRINMTRSKTGVLIYLSLMERQAIVLADKSIADKLPKETWQDIVNTIIHGIRKKNVAEGILNGLEDCRKRLSENFPIEQNDTNELPNQVILRTNP